MAKSGVEKEIAALSFEDAMSALDEVVSKLESGQVPLEQSIELYTRGIALKAHCEAKLQDAKARIEKLTFDSDGKPSGLAPMDGDQAG